MSEHINYIDAQSFQEQVTAAGAAVVDFYSTECPPCDALAPKFEALAELYGEKIRFYKNFRQENRELAESLGVRSSPTVLFFRDGHQTGDVLSGAISRAHLMDNLDALLPDGEGAAIRRRIKAVSTACDVAVIGAGPAGLTAGIYLAQAKLDTILIDRALAGGQVTTTHQVSNYPGFVEPVPGFMLTHYMGEQARAAGCDTRYAAEVTALDLDRLCIELDGYETIHAKKIILATGASYRRLGIPGEAEYKGQGISYCATCDAKYYQDKEVTVIGGGNSALEEALFITKFARKVRIVHQFAELQANKLAQEKAFANEKIEFLFEHEPRAFEKLDQGMRVSVENMQTGEHSSFETGGVFIFAGMSPNLDLVDGKLELDEWGYVKTDALMHTNLPHVFAVGDVSSKRFRQITVAVSDGTIAAIQAARETEDESG